MDVSTEERERKRERVHEILRLYGEWGAASGELFGKPNDPELRARLRHVLVQLTILGEGEDIPKVSWDLCNETI